MVAPAGAQDRSTPALSEVEQLRRENIWLKSRLSLAVAERDICKGKLAPGEARANDATLQQEIDKLKSDVEAAHPGFSFNTQTGALEPKPPAPSPKDR
jgi:hypothetical protein